MFVYLLLIALALILIIQSGFFLAKRRKNQSIIGFLFVLIVVLIGTFRDTTIGTDIGLHSNEGYYYFFRNTSGFGRDLEVGFKYLTFLIRRITDSYYFYYSLIYLLNILFYYLACRKMKIRFPLFMAILFLSSLLTPSFNVIRQMLGLSVGLFLYGTLYYQKELSVKNVIRYEVSILLFGVTIHTSIVLLCLIPLMDIPAVHRLFSKTWFLAVLAIGCVLLSKFGADLISQNLLRFSGFLGERADFYIDMVDKYEIERTHGYVTDAINFALIIILSMNNRNTLFRIGFLGYALSCIASSGLGFIGRAFGNLVIFTCLYYASSWSSFVVNTKTKTITIFMMILRIAFWLSSLYYTVLQNESICPYSSYLLK